MPVDSFLHILVRYRVLNVINESALVEQETSILTNIYYFVLYPTCVFLIQTDKVFFFYKKKVKIFLLEIDLEINL